MKALEIRIYGVVQGVGFRPFVARLAKSLSLQGWVTNEGGAVHIVVKGTQENIDCFLHKLVVDKPGPSFILSLDKGSIPMDRVFADDFTIRESEEKEEDLVFLPPDMSLCPDCLKEMDAEKDRRFRHPFISCMLCGPRYTIIDRIPYDRENTSMLEFPLCEQCRDEYDNIGERRYHAQTVSCYDCGPLLLYRDNKAEGSQGCDLQGEEALLKAIEVLNRGGIVAVKGIGGYHLACSPYIEDTVRLLREIKGREAKPFAVIFPNITSIRDYCDVDETGMDALLAPEKPIVLLPKKREITARPFSTLVDRDSLDYGIFLPYTPFQVLLLAETGPLIMTSANISDQPIIRDDEEMLDFRHSGLDGVLYHKRKIRVSVDDSVVRPLGEDIQLIRRARGYVPLPVNIKTRDKDRAGSKIKAPRVLACGGMLKNTFCLVKDNFAYLSQHMGDLSDARTWQEYLYNIERLQHLLKIKPELVCCDLHPDYPTTRFAFELTPDPVQVQHHHAHIASVMAEKGLHEEVLGVAFDGTGYGTDGKIWGGEFLLSTPADFTRLGNLQYVPLAGGDASMREGWKAAAFYLSQAGLEEMITDPRWQVLKAAWKAGIQTVDSSSMGRLFDAVSSILGICHTADYEGEGAVRLEQAAVQWLYQNGFAAMQPYDYTIEKQDGVCRLNFLPMIRGIAGEKGNGAEPGRMAARFHLTAAQAAASLCRELCSEYRLDKVVLSGGVFQNRLLLQQLIDLLHEKYHLEVFYNILVPPNDGGIALGQALVGLSKRGW